jgi:signal transduction histidine kinase
VSDTGIGIPPEDLKELFGRFHRGRNANPYPGNGLGLAIVKATMDIHGGAVSVESGPGGSTFALSLPTV